MFPPRRLRQLASALAVSALLATATVQAGPAHAADPASARALPLGSAAEESAATPKADLIVLFQKAETKFYGTEMRYTVANGGSATAQNVVVTKMVKVKQNGAPNAVATPVYEQLGPLNPGQWREILVVCGAALGDRCEGSSVSAKTNSPELTLTNDSASKTF